MNSGWSMSLTELKFLARQKGYELLPADDRARGYRRWYEKKPADVTLWESASNPATGDDVFPLPRSHFRVPQDLLRSCSGHREPSQTEAKHNGDDEAIRS